MAKYEEFIGTTHGDFKVIGIDNERHISKKRRLICECQKCGAKESILGEVIRKGKHTQCLSCIANLPKRMESFQGIA